MQHITGKPSIVLHVIVLAVNIIIDISFLLGGQFVWFFMLLIFTILPAIRLINALKNKIVVSDQGIYGQTKKEHFRLGYHEISSVSMADKDDGKNLLIVSGYQSYSIEIKNAQAVRDAIIHNMRVLNVTPASMPPTDPTAPTQLT